MDTQTLLNIILSIVTVYLAIRTFLTSTRKDAQRESQEMTEIRVQLQQVMSLLRDLQNDVRTSTADFRLLSERVAIIETNLQTAFLQIKEMKKVKTDEP